MHDFVETLAPGVQFSVTPDRMLYSGHSEHQRIDVFEHATLGRVLALDGVVQTTESDEFIYHEMLVHTAMLSHGAARRVLIIGGGDGGTLREVLRHPVEQAVLVELDEAVVGLCRRYLPSISDGAFDDPRAELVFDDGAAWLQADSTRFDVIIVDSTDPEGPGIVLFQSPFFDACAAHLAAGGLLVNQNGTPAFMPGALGRSAAALDASFDHAGFFYVAVPSYVSGVMALGWASNDVDVATIERATLSDRFDALGLETRWYTPSTQRAAFAEPPLLKAIRQGDPADPRLT